MSVVVTVVLLFRDTMTLRQLYKKALIGSSQLQRLSGKQGTGGQAWCCRSSRERTSDLKLQAKRVWDGAWLGLLKP